MENPTVQVLFVGAGDLQDSAARHLGRRVTVRSAPDATTARMLQDTLAPDILVADEAELEGLHDLPGELIVLGRDDEVMDAVTAFRRGAADYLVPPYDFGRVGKLVERVRESRRLRSQLGRLRSQLRRRGQLCDLVGASRAMQETYDLIERCAPVDETVLVIGETGTGKELVARAIHELSPRSDEPFVALNCGALAPTLIESELFGHVAGSFTGATGDRDGVFVRADGGTLFLDEVTEMDPDLQTRLLRVLETSRVLPVGAAEPREVDVRVVGATNREPGQAVAEGALREDLLYRLMVLPIRLAPLRDRGGDVDLLARHFLSELNQTHDDEKRLSGGAIDRLRAHDWPGNVRELSNAMTRAFVLAGSEPVIAANHVPLGALLEREEDGLRMHVGETIAVVERRLLLATLDALDGDKRRAAEMLGVSVKTIYNRLKSYAADEE